MQERVEREGELAIFRSRPEILANVRRRGEDLGAGAEAIAVGTLLRPGHIALAASCDRAWLDVARRPVVTLIGTGDELRPPGSAARSGSIPESNGPRPPRDGGAGRRTRPRRPVRPGTNEPA